MRTYEQLSGAKGKKIYYRAERFPAGPLFGKLRPFVEIGGEKFDVQDVSMTGLALLAPINRLPANRVGETVDYRMRVGNMVLHEGTAKVSRVHRRPSNVVIGLGLTKDYLDVAHLVTKQQDLLVRHELQKFTRPSDNIDPAYKLVVADVLDMLRRYSGFLAQQRRVLNGVKPVDEDDAAEILGLCEEHMIPEWRTLWRRANDLVVPLIDDPEALRSVKLYTERLLTPEFMPGSIWRRAYEKPLGYPGDYLLMDQVYSWKYEGDTLREKLVHRLGLDVAECIATRMVMVQQTIAEIVNQSANGSPVRVTSLGSGPAQEVRNYLGGQPLPGAVEFTLIDQEKAALALAYDKVYPLTVPHSGDAKVSCLQVSFMEMLKGEGAFDLLAPQDLIYSVGLVDYLAPQRAQQLVGTLYRRLKPGGSLVIGNMKETREGNFWPMEVICDWSLNYRDEAQMLAMADGLDVAHVEVRTEPTGRVHMLYLRKA
jgi:hypothetical protein